MRKGKSVIGLRVVSQSESAQLGTVKDLIFDHDANQLVALLLSEKDLFGLIDAQIVPWDKVRSLGADAVLVESNDSKMKAGDDQRVSAIMASDSVLSGTQILTSDGRNLGTFADLYIDEETGRVVGYEVSGGFVSDTLSGKHFLPAPREVAVGQHVVIVPPAVTEQLEAQQQHLGESLRAMAGKVSEAYSGLATASVEKQKEYVVGKTASREVIIPAGTVVQPGAEPPVRVTDVSSDTGTVAGEVLVQRDEIITREHAERAAATGVLGQLVLAAAVSAAGESYAGTRDRVGSALAPATSEARHRAVQGAIGAKASHEVVAPDGSIIVEEGETITAGTIERARLYDREEDVLMAGGVGAFHQGAARANEHLAGLWGSLRNTVSNLTSGLHEKLDERDDAAEQAKIDEALGLPVDRVILDRDDNVILNAGEIVTNRAVARARDGGVLEILLKSVGTAAPAAPPQAEQNGQQAEQNGQQGEHNGHEEHAAIPLGPAEVPPALPGPRS